MKQSMQIKLENLFEFVKKYKKENGFCPSVREMCDYLGVNSTSTITYYLNHLEKQGKIKRGACKNRAIEVLVNDEPTDESNLDIVKNCTAIPMVGQITAGQPILAVENYEDTFYMPNGLFKGDNLFILTVKGESMINAGIYDGDNVIIRQQNTAQNGEIVAVLIDDSATIKRFYKENDIIRLQPENDSMEPMYFKEVSILGKVVGLIRRM